MTANEDILNDLDYVALTDMVEQVCINRNDNPVAVLSRLIEHYQTTHPFPGTGHLQTLSEDMPEEYMPFHHDLDAAMLNSPFSSPYPNASSPTINWMASTLV